MSDLVEDLTHYLQHRWKGWTDLESESCYRHWEKIYGKTIADQVRAKMEGKRK